MNSDPFPDNRPEDFFLPREDGIPRTLIPMTSPDSYLEHSRQFKKAGGRFLGLWAKGDPSPCLDAAFLLREGLVILLLSLNPDPGQIRRFPSLSGTFPTAVRFERTVRELFGFIPEGLSDLRPWIGQDLWEIPPLSRPPGASIFLKSALDREDYPFVTVRGPGVHEIPVGPVHAGIIEPGHFRFHVLGEKILRLEERLGYTHKGVDGLFRSRSLDEGCRIASRISGDSTVANSMAFAQAVEHALNFLPSIGARFVRAFLLERERLANHMGDLGSLANDAGLSFGFSQFSRLKESLLRKNQRHFGARYLFDMIRPGGVRVLITDQALSDFLGEIKGLLEETLELQTLYEDHGGLQDRFQNTGILLPETASHFGLGGVVGRASAQAWDLRTGHGGDPYHRFPPALALAHTGDVAARVQIRFLEIQESLLLCRSLLEHLPEQSLLETLPSIHRPSEGVGIVEGFRGEIVAWVRLGTDNFIEAAHLQDPSAILWPALEHAVLGNLVADFPLINKSFNLSYSGNDL